MDASASDDALRESAEELATRCRRIAALVAAASDMAASVKSQDVNLCHAQELLAAADEVSPGVISAIEALIILLSASAHLRAA